MVVCASTVTDSRNRKDAVKAAHASGRAKRRVMDMIMLRNVDYQRQARAAPAALTKNFCIRYSPGC